jgi:CO/xanthine dehydrogenase FAD-binding subunit
MSYLRRLPKFEYLATRSIDEACDLLAAHNNEAGLLAGGTDLLLQMRRRETSPAYIIGLKGVTELSGVRALADG